MKTYIVVILCCFTLLSCATLKSTSHNYVPKEGYIPNKETAVKMAEIIWLPIYGDKINDFKPFIATLESGKIWIVEGTLKSSLGGVPYIEIQKKDGRILRVTHGK